MQKIKIEKNIFFLTLLFFLSINATKNYERSIVAVLCARNVSEWIEKTLESIYMQKYQNYHVIFVDDASSDGTAKKIQQFVDDHNWHDKFTLIVNEYRARKTINFYNAVHMCADNDIIIQLDGDDWFAHDQVFSTINDRYKDSNIWMTYGQYKNEPKHIAQIWGFSEIGYAAPYPRYVINNRSYRTSQWRFMPTRSFYAWLYKAIRIEDLMTENVKNYEGDFLPTCDDLAMMYPIAEMCGTKFKFYNEIFYIRNLWPNDISFKIEKHLFGVCEKEIIRRPKYPVAKEPLVINSERFYDNYADLILILSKDTNIREYISLLRTKLKNIETVYVIIKDEQDSSEIVLYDHDVYKISYKNVDDTENFKKALLLAANHSTNEHIFLANENTILHQTISCGDMIYWIERTGAHGFHTNMSGKTREKTFLSTKINSDVSVCIYRVAKQSWYNCDLTTGTLIRKNDFTRTVMRWKSSTDGGLYDFPMAESSKVGLFYAETI